MSTTTPELSLVKADYSDLADVKVYVADNFQKIDDAMFTHFYRRDKLNIVDNSASIFGIFTINRAFGLTTGISETFSAANGTFATPSQTLQNDIIYAATYQGRNEAGAYNNVAKIEIKAAENTNSATSGGAMYFYTTNVGSTTPTEKLRIPAQGGLIMPERSDPGNPSADSLHIYVADVAGVTRLKAKDSAGNIRTFSWT